MTNEQFLEILIDLYAKFESKRRFNKRRAIYHADNKSYVEAFIKKCVTDAFLYCRDAVDEKIKMLTENKETPNCGNDCAEWFMKQPLAKRLTDDEIKKLNDLMFLMRKMRTLGMMSTGCIKNISNALYDIFGLEVFEEQRKYAIL